MKIINEKKKTLTIKELEIQEDGFLDVETSQELDINNVIREAFGDNTVKITVAMAEKSEE